MDNSRDDFLAKPLGDRHIRLSISRNTLLALMLSIVVHLLVLLLIVPQIDMKPSASATTIEVSLAPKPQAKKQAEPLPITPAEIPPEPKPTVIAKKQNSPASKPKANDFSVPKVLTTPRPSQQQVPATPPLSSKPQVPQSAPADAPKDMAEYIAQRRAQREASELDAARQNAAAAAAEQGPSEEAKRDARIKNNFNNGTNGIFDITELSSTNARFSFLGWTSSLSNAHRDFFEVEAKNGQDVRLIMIRRMIAIIRQHYQGDFDWDSQRLGRTISKSARLEDSAELEDFLMQEFFGTNYKTKQ